MKLTDEQQEAFDSVYPTIPRGAWDSDMTKAFFLAGIAHAQQWRPIATAPGYMTPILLRNATGGIVVGKWVYNYWEIVGGGGAIFEDAMHWLPLPPAPEEGK